MKRAYNAARRAENAAQTRQAIIDAAIRVHGRGVTTIAAVAEEAGVSMPTVTKHFPTREDLFFACTTHFAAALEYPSVDVLAALPDPAARLLEGVRQLFRLHEGTSGQMWTGYRLADESPMLAKSVDESNQFVAAYARALLADLIADESERAGIEQFAAGLLNALAYRALRKIGGLSFDDAVRHTARALAGVLRIQL